METPVWARRLINPEVESKSTFVFVTVGSVVAVVPWMPNPPLTETKRLEVAPGELWAILGVEAIPDPNNTLLAPEPKRPAPVLYVAPGTNTFCIATAYRYAVPAVTQGFVPA